MGVGDPVDIIEGVIRGIDIFDCVLPTRIARHGNAFTRYGKINLKNAKFKEDFTPVEEVIVIVMHVKIIQKHILDI